MTPITEAPADKAKDFQKRRMLEAVGETVQTLHNIKTIRGSAVAEKLAGQLSQRTSIIN